MTGHPRPYNWEMSELRANPHSQLPGRSDRRTQSCLVKGAISLFLLEGKWEKTGLQGLRWVGGLKDVQAACRDPEALRMLATAALNSPRVS